MNLKLHVTNKAVTPSVGISVFHVGANRYRVYLDGIGSYSLHNQLGIAASKAMWLGNLSQDDFNWEVAKVQEANKQ